ncbi:hypothetical protein ACERII_07250 [Evansella sp. AB-rgal1]|uniref:hypothetical protein n=1 Tax=Evansella sp. AB-rgal1 TaxID=3242696 RepID=UPI00359E14BC
MIKNRFFLILLIVMLTTIYLAACDSNELKNDNTLRIMFISDVPLRTQENFDPYISSIVSELGYDKEDLEISVQLFPISHDKLTIEIVLKEVDIFIVDDSLKNILLDPYGLHPLDSFRTLLSDSTFEQFIMNDEDTGEPHLYAIPFDNDSKIIQDIGIQLPTPLIGVVTKTSNQKELAVKILEELL